MPHFLKTLVPLRIQRNSDSEQIVAFHRIHIVESHRHAMLLFLACLLKVQESYPRNSLAVHCLSKRLLISQHSSRDIRIFNFRLLRWLDALPLFGLVLTEFLIENPVAVTLHERDSGVGGQYPTVSPLL
jgi:hypothetical protein